MKANRPFITAARAAISATVLLSIPAGTLTAQPIPTTPTPAPSPDGFVVGVDTLQAVEAKLGKPFTVASSSHGMTSAIYVSTKTHVKGATLIPIAGLFAGGAKGHSATKTFIFDDKGLLKSFSSSETNIDCHTGFSASCH